LAKERVKAQTMVHVLDNRRIRRNLREGGLAAPEGFRRASRLAGAARDVLTTSLAVGLSVCAAQPPAAAEPSTVKVAVFDFELDDRSAGSGIIELDAADAEHLRLSTEEARRLLAAANGYSLVDTSSVAPEVSAAGGIRHCNGCEGPLARKLGADQSMAGIITRITRTEYTLQIAVRNTGTGAIVSNAFTGLRMGANYSWPRGVKWLVNNRILQ
jgi:hypothetical protein